MKICAVSRLVGDCLYSTPMFKCTSIRYFLIILYVPNLRGLEEALGH